MITDEMYASIIFDEYYSVAQCDSIRDKVIFVGGFSKMFSMTGLRIGYVACSDIYMKEIMKVHQYGVSCAPSIAQYGALEGLKKAMKDVEKMKESFERRKNYCIKRLKELNIDSKIKWPNDIHLNNKKLCGILGEMSCDMDTINYLAIGIGMNINVNLIEMKFLQNF